MAASAESTPAGSAPPASDRTGRPEGALSRVTGALGGSRRSARLVEAFSVAWPPWLISRVVVFLALATAKYLVDHHHVTTAKAVLQSRYGLLAFDAGWYQTIAAHGYGALPRQALRFFPLLPLLARGLHAVTGGLLTVGIAVLVVVSVCSLLAGMALYLLARRELDEVAARRSAWLLQLAPPAFVLVMGYSEALLILLAVLVFLAYRRQHWWWAALFGCLAGLARPVGCLLVLPVLIGALRERHGVRPTEWLARAVAVGAPAAGTAAFLAYSAVAFGSFWEPLRVQEQGNLHGRFSNPFAVVYHGITGVLHGHHFGTALHIPWLAVAAVLVIVALRVLPVDYGLFSVAVLVAALSGSHLDSFERYALSTVALVMAGAVLLRSSRVAVVVLTLSGAGLFGYALLAFLGTYVP